MLHYSFLLREGMQNAIFLISELYFCKEACDETFIFLVGCEDTSTNGHSE